MAPPRRDKAMRRHVAQMEAKRALRETQERRRRRDNLFGASAGAAVLALAIALQALWFSFDPSAEQVDRLGDPPGVPSSASPGATTTPANAGTIPDPATAAGRVFSGTLALGQGEIGVELDGNVAPQAAAVFASLAEEGFFAGKTCHRLTTSDNLGILQCGSADGAGGSDPGYQWGPVENPPADGRYPAGSIAVARGASTTSHGTQFFITYKDSRIPQDTGGYTIMGRVTSGLDVVQAIAEDGVDGGSEDGPPAVPVTIDSFTLN